MRILPDIQAASIERPQQAREPATAFEQTLDLTMLKTLRQQQDRAFAFARRGVLALADSNGGRPEERQTSSTAPSPTIPIASLVPHLDRSAESISTSVTETNRAGVPVKAAIAAPPSDLRADMAPVRGPLTVQGGLASAPAAMKPVNPETAPGDPEVGAARPDRPQDAASPSGDTSLTVHWTSDGLVVFAAAPIVSPDKIGRLRARAEDIAREHGRRLIQFHLNGAPVAPQPLSRRL